MLVEDTDVFDVQLRTARDVTLTFGDYPPVW